MRKVQNNGAWLLVLPVFLLVAFSAVIPLMTVVNYAFNDSFGENSFFWNGFDWFKEVIDSDRIRGALWRQFLFSGIVLLIEIPLGIAIALTLPKRGFWASLVLVLLGHAAGHPMERGRHDLAGLCARRHRAFGRRDHQGLGRVQHRPRSAFGLDRRGDDGCLALDLAGRPSGLRRAAGHPRGLLPGRQASTRPAAGRSSATSNCRS